MTQFELEQARELNKGTSKKLEDALIALRISQEEARTTVVREGVEQSVTNSDDRAQEEAEAPQVDVKANAEGKEEFQLVINNAQQTIQELQARNQDLEQQLRASENKISILLDNFQGPDSVRNSTGSMSGSDDLILRLLEANHHLLPASAAFGNGRSYLTPKSHGSNLTDRSSSDSLANELELLRSNWGQAQLNGAIHRPGAAVGPAGPSTTQAISIDTTASPNVATDLAAEATTADESSTTLGSPQPVAEEEESNNSSVSPSTLKSAQKLEEYEKMIEDMANARRQYEE
jgi:hypothetical protein